MEPTTPALHCSITRSGPETMNMGRRPGAVADDDLAVGAGTVARLVSAGRAGALAAVASYAGRPRNPVLFARSVFEDVAASVTGDRGARDWLRSHPDLVVPVPCDDVGDPTDVDTPADLARLVDSHAERAGESGDRGES